MQEREEGRGVDLRRQMASLPALSAAVVLPSSPRLGYRWRENGRVFGSARAKIHDCDDNPFLQAAINSASLRFHHTHRPDPLFLDPYAGCFLPPVANKDMQFPASTVAHCHYCLATKFIDDKLLTTTSQLDELRQVVLLTDGMDTRPYRLKWPHSTLIFDISPGTIFTTASKMLEGVGAKISRNCMLLHIPLESSDIPQIMRGKGFNGSRPSIWALQGLPVLTSTGFKEILFIVSCLATKGSIFIGELPSWPAETELGIKMSIRKLLEKLFFSHGFQVDMVAYDEIARNMNQDPPSGDYGNILFIAQHLQFSDDQMEHWRREFQRIEEEGDEEGFEEL